MFIKIDNITINPDNIAYYGDSRDDEGNPITHIYFVGIETPLKTYIQKNNLDKILNAEGRYCD